MTTETLCSTVVQGAEEARFVVLSLMKAGQWFEFEPYPDDNYLITVKYGARDLLVELLWRLPAAVQ